MPGSTGNHSSGGDQADKLIEETVALHTHQYPQNSRACGCLIDCLSQLVPPAVRLAGVTARVKDPGRLQKKLWDRVGKENDLTSGHNPTPESVLSKVKDLVGCRILVYSNDDVAQVKAALDKGLEHSRGPLVKLNDGEENPRQHRPAPWAGRYYAAWHYRVGLNPEYAGFADLKEIRAEVQVLTMTTHIWAEFDHDIQYKKFDTSLTRANKGLLNKLGKYTRVVADILSAINAESMNARQFQEMLSEKLAEIEEIADKGPMHDLYDELGGMSAFEKVSEVTCSNCGQTWIVTARPTEAPFWDDSDRLQPPEDDGIYRAEHPCPECSALLPTVDWSDDADIDSRGLI